MNFHTKHIDVSYRVSLDDLYEIVRNLPAAEQAVLITELLCCENEKVNAAVANWFKDNARYLIETASPTQPKPGDEAQ